MQLLLLLGAIGHDRWQALPYANREVIERPRQSPLLLVENCRLHPGAAHATVFLWPDQMGIARFGLLALPLTAALNICLCVQLIRRGGLKSAAVGLQPGSDFLPEIRFFRVSLKSMDLACGQVYGLEFEVVLQPFLTQFAPKSRGLVAAKGRRHIHRETVDGEISGWIFDLSQYRLPHPPSRPSRRAPSRSHWRYE